MIKVAASIQVGQSVDKVYSGDSGFDIVVQVKQGGQPLAVANFSTYQMVFTDPDGIQSTKTAVASGTHSIKYLVEDDFLTKVGQWRVLGKLDDKHSGPVHILNIEPVL